MPKYSLGRYDETETAVVFLDPLEDLLGWIRGIHSISVMTDLSYLHPSVSELTAKERRARLRSLVAHVGIAIDYIDQAFSGSINTSFLPLYYAILNLAKAYILTGPFAKELGDQRFHGVSAPSGNVGDDLLKDCVLFQRRGAVPLFYATVTGSKPVQPISLQLSSIYSLIWGVGFEFGEATKLEHKTVPADFAVEVEADKWRCSATVTGQTPIGPKLKYPGLAGLRRLHSRSTTRVSRYFPDSNEIIPEDAIRRFMIYHSTIAEADSPTRTPYSNLNLLPFQELPILIALYHLSSLVRYNPEQFNYVEDSKYWPMLIALRKYGLFEFLLLFYSFMQKKIYTFSNTPRNE